MSEFVSLRDVKKIYHMGEIDIAAANGITFDIRKGEFAVVVGPSGAGKTTVLNILGGMDTATSGEVWIDGQDITKYKGKELTAYRRDDIGFVFQFYNLIPNLTALENVELALRSAGTRWTRERSWSMWAWARGWITSRPSSREESSRGFPSPGRWRKIPSFSCATSLRVRWITTREKPS